MDQRARLVQHTPDVSNNLIAYNWTSGYFNALNRLRKPSGKCSHGGSFDVTRNHRQGWN